MIGQTVSHYRILEYLGGGGMGVVYRAEDVRLGRHVALKFLPRELTRDTLSRRRFEQEAQAASMLDHPNICTIYGIDQTDDGQLFLALALYEGETLKRRLACGPLPAAQAVSVAVHIARGLAAAHARGIVHRDIKPANIFMTREGHLKILDFGLAKLSGQMSITRIGAIIGTLDYMSPEQAGGQPVDHRSDIWSLGVVLYEMLAGRNPFRREPDIAVLQAICNEEPQPLSAVCSAPAHLEAILTRCLRKSPDARYPDMEALLRDLEAGAGGYGRAGGAGAAAGHGGAAGAAGAVGPGMAGGLESVALREKSIGVLPFANMSTDPDQEYFCDGMVEEIINALSNIPGLRVVSRSSSFAFKRKQADARDIGRKLGVQSLLEGSVRKVGNRVRISVQLVDVAGGHHVWSERFDRELEDIFALQEDIARKVASALQVTLEGDEAITAGVEMPGNVRAYELYLKGREYLYQQNRRSLQFARQMFRRAIELAPDYALAYAGLSDACCLSCMWYERADRLLAEANEASLKALAIAPDSAQANASRGLSLSLNRHYEDARRHFDAAISRDPHLFEAWYFYARDQMAQGRLELAAGLLRRAHEVRPDDFGSLFLATQALRGAGKLEEARIMGRRAVGVAERHLDLYPEATRALYLGAATLVFLGEKEKGLAWAGRAQELDTEDEGMLYNLACVYCLAGEQDRAMGMLERWATEGAVHKEWLLNDPDFEALREDPRFKALVERLP
jgi:TolB-like protein/Tfp pilus assembly protein PilF